MASLTQWIWVEQTVGVSDGLEAWRAAVHGVTKSQTQLSNWTTAIECNGGKGVMRTIVTLSSSVILNLLEKFISSLGAREISLPLRNFIFHSFSLWELILNILSYFSFSFDQQEIQSQIFLLSIKNCVGLLSVYSHFNFLYFPALNFLYNAMKW